MHRLLAIAPKNQTLRGATSRISSAVSFRPSRQLHVAERHFNVLEANVDTGSAEFKVGNYLDAGQPLNCLNSQDNANEMGKLVTQLKQTVEKIKKGIQTTGIDPCV
jgi:hypothetical protein